MHADFFPATMNHSEIKVAEECCGAMTGSGAVVLQPVRFQCIVFQISSGLPCVYVYIWLYEYSYLTCPKFDLCQTFQNITVTKVVECLYWTEWLYWRWISDFCLLPAVSQSCCMCDFS